LKKSEETKKKKDRPTVMQTEKAGMAYTLLVLMMLAGSQRNTCLILRWAVDISSTSQIRVRCSDVNEDTQLAQLLSFMELTVVTCESFYFQ
jgi:hypothetical protein